MPDWKSIVARQLDRLGLDAAEKAEVFAEVAAHLEETFEEMRSRGLKEDEAVRRTLAQAGNWRTLQRNILFAKRGGSLMNTRLRQLWAPGLLAMAVSTALLFGFLKFGFHPRIVYWNGPKNILVYGPWLVSLPILGAIATCFSSREGGSRRTALLVSVFPALAFAVTILLMFPIGMVIERIIGIPVDFIQVATVILTEGIGWIAVPAAALLAGGLFAQFLLCRPSPSQGMALRS
jgi:hypothetical protein